MDTIAFTYHVTFSDADPNRIAIGFADAIAFSLSYDYLDPEADSYGNAIAVCHAICDAGQQCVRDSG